MKTKSQIKPIINIQKSEVAPAIEKLFEAEIEKQKYKSAT